MLEAVRKNWRTYFTTTADDKPQLGSLSQPVLSLMFLLCLFFFALGRWLENLGSQRAGHILNLMIITLLLLNHLAFQFRWSLPTTRALRGGALLWMVGTVVVLFRE
jgi:hypothetical protein